MYQLFHYLTGYRSLNITEAVEGHDQVLAGRLPLTDIVLRVLVAAAVHPLAEEVPRPLQEDMSS